MSPSDAAVEVEQDLPAGFAHAYRAVTDPTMISRWLAACSMLDDGAYLLAFDEDDGTVTRKRATPACGHRGGDRSRFSFLLQDPGYPDSIVEVDVRGLGAHRSRISLRHRSPPSELVEGYRSGWRDYLRDLADLLAVPAVGGEEW